MECGPIIDRFARGPKQIPSGPISLESLNINRSINDVSIVLQFTFATKIKLMETST